ncbi:hypothetical protein [Acetobacterium wieringae]|uniref:hypothetical protein n=1 Tax=Acetobacterium wieringae TaxID=52694 RepID=UPI0026E994EB|nr:hypothetical protein [Acetobacterium wieringae]
MNRKKKPARRKNNSVRKKVLILIGGILLCIVIAGVSLFMFRASDSSDLPDPSDLSSSELSTPATSIETPFAQTLAQLTETSNRITGLKINQTLLSLSGLNQSVTTIMENQKLIIARCAELNEMIANIPESDENMTLFSEINQLNKNLDSNCDQILEAKKQRDLTALETLLSDTANLQNAIIDALEQVS